MPSRSVVVIEDEAPIAEAIAARLRNEGFAVQVAGDGPAGVETCRRTRPDLVVLDLMLPGLDGLEVCRRIQQDARTPVIMLTARDSETDMLVGLGVGADDYITKPFSSRELVARIHAVLRRAEPANGNGAPAVASASIRLGGVEIDPESRRVKVDGELVHLTPTEFDMLLHMSRRPGVVFTRDQLLGEVWGYRDAYGTRTVDSHVRGLRRKLGPGLIRTVHGVGYAVERP